MIDCSKFNFDVEVVFLRLAPWFWLITPEDSQTKEVFVEYLKTIASALEYYQESLLNQCEDKESFLLETGQHLALEERLNRLFDPILKRIYITENDVSILNRVWFLEGEEDPINKVWYLTGETSPTLENWYLTGEETSLFNFTVHVPASLSSREDEIIATINNYVVNGYTFEIVYF